MQPSIDLSAATTRPLAVFGGMEIGCLPIGWILLAAGLWRSRTAGRMVPALLVLGLVLFLALPDHLGAIGAAMLLTATTRLVRRITRTAARQSP